MNAWIDQLTVYKTARFELVSRPSSEHDGGWHVEIFGVSLRTGGRTGLLSSGESRDKGHAVVAALSCALGQALDELNAEACDTPGCGMRAFGRQGDALVCSGCIK